MRRDLELRRCEAEERQRREALRVGRPLDVDGHRCRHEADRLVSGRRTHHTERVESDLGSRRSRDHSSTDHDRCARVVQGRNFQRHT